MFIISHSWGVPQQRSPAPMNKICMICATSQFHRKAAARHPPNRNRPWKLIIGWDEFTPGNALAPDNRRKTMVLPFSFVELGQVALSCGSAWVIPVVLRTSLINQVDGGMSNVMRVFLRRLLFGPEGLATVGVPLLINGQHTMLFASGCDVGRWRRPSPSLELARCRFLEAVFCALQHLEEGPRRNDLPCNRNAMCVCERISSPR